VCLGVDPNHGLNNLVANSFFKRNVMALRTELQQACRRNPAGGVAQPLYVQQGLIQVRHNIFHILDPH
jgi:hypothetical protein